MRMAPPYRTSVEPGALLLVLDAGLEVEVELQGCVHLLAEYDLKMIEARPARAWRAGRGSAARGTLIE